MYETETYNDTTVLSSSVRRRWNFVETGSACAIMRSVCADEWRDIVSFLEDFTLVPSEWLKKGGNRGTIAKKIDGIFAGRGWKETRIDLETQGILINRGGSERDRLKAVYQEGYLVDNFKGRVVVDVEWNAKDGNLDRDLSAYRAWHEAGVIVAAVLITQNRRTLKSLADRLWSEYQETVSENSKSKKLPIDLNTSTTTNLEKTELRIKRGVMGTCPLLVVAVTDSTWNGQPYAVT